MLSRNLCTYVYSSNIIFRCRKCWIRRKLARRSDSWRQNEDHAISIHNVVKTHAHNSDVTRGHASASTHWPFMKSRLEAHSLSSALFGSASCTRTEEHAATTVRLADRSVGQLIGRSVHSISFICRIIVVFLFATQGRANERVLALKVPASGRSSDRRALPLVIVFLSAVTAASSLLYIRDVPRTNLLNHYYEMT